MVIHEREKQVQFTCHPSIFPQETIAFPHTAEVFYGYVIFQHTNYLKRYSQVSRISKMNNYYYFIEDSFNGNLHLF
jgi:hypothetical protein